METMPDAAELIEAVAECLRGELLPHLSGRAAFQARVAANVLDIARRELRGARQADAAEATRLALLAGAAPAAADVSDGDPAPARRALAAAIRDGRIGLDTPGLREHLWADVLARVAIEQPGYASFLRETAHTPSAD